MDLALINLQRLICHKTQSTNEPATMYTYKHMYAHAGMHINYCI